MEFEDSPAITPKDRMQADAARVNLQPLHGNLDTSYEPGRGVDLQGAGKRSFEFEAESTASSAQVASNHVKPTHHMALVGALVVCALFVGGLVLLQNVL